MTGQATTASASASTLAKLDFKDGFSDPTTDWSANAIGTTFGDTAPNQFGVVFDTDHDSAPQVSVAPDMLRLPTTLQSIAPSLAANILGVPPGSPIADRPFDPAKVSNAVHAAPSGVLLVVATTLKQDGSMSEPFYMTVAAPSPFVKGQCFQLPVGPTNQVLSPGNVPVPSATVSPVLGSINPATRSAACTDKTPKGFQQRAVFSFNTDMRLFGSVIGTATTDPATRALDLAAIQGDHLRTRWGTAQALDTLCGTDFSSDEFATLCWPSSVDRGTGDVVVNPRFLMFGQVNPLPVGVLGPVSEGFDTILQRINQHFGNDLFLDWAANPVVQEWIAAVEKHPSCFATQWLADAWISASLNDAQHIPRRFANLWFDAVRCRSFQLLLDWIRGTQYRSSPRRTKCFMMTYLPRAAANLTPNADLRGNVHITKLFEILFLRRPMTDTWFAANSEMGLCHFVQDDAVNARTQEFLRFQVPTIKDPQPPWVAPPLETKAEASDRLEEERELQAAQPQQTCPVAAGRMALLQRPPPPPPPTVQQPPASAAAPAASSLATVTPAASSHGLTAPTTAGSNNGPSSATVANASGTYSTPASAAGVQQNRATTQAPWVSWFTNQNTVTPPPAPPAAPAPAPATAPATQHARPHHSPSVTFAGVRDSQFRTPPRDPALNPLHSSRASCASSHYSDVLLSHCSKRRRLFGPSATHTPDPNASQRNQPHLWNPFDSNLNELPKGAYLFPICNCLKVDDLSAEFPQSINGPPRPVTAAEKFIPGPISESFRREMLSPTNAKDVTSWFNTRIVFANKSNPLTLGFGTITTEESIQRTNVWTRTGSPSVNLQRLPLSILEAFRSGSWEVYPHLTTLPLSSTGFSAFSLLSILPSNVEKGTVKYPASGVSFEEGIGLLNSLLHLFMLPLGDLVGEHGAGLSIDRIIQASPLISNLLNMKSALLATGVSQQLVSVQQLWSSDGVRSQHRCLHFILSQANDLLNIFFQLAKLYQNKPPFVSATNTVDGSDILLLLTTYAVGNYPFELSSATVHGTHKTLMTALAQWEDIFRTRYLNLSTEIAHSIIPASWINDLPPPAAAPSSSNNASQDRGSQNSKSDKGKKSSDKSQDNKTATKQRASQPVLKYASSAPPDVRNNAPAMFISKLPSDSKMPQLLPVNGNSSESTKQLCFMYSFHNPKGCSQGDKCKRVHLDIGRVGDEGNCKKNLQELQRWTELPAVQGKVVLTDEASRWLSNHC